MADGGVPVNRRALSGRLPSLRSETAPPRSSPGRSDAHGSLEVACFRLVPLFAGLSDDDLDQLAAGAQTRSFARGEVVFEAGRDPGRLFVVARGLVKVTRISAAGREQVVRLLGPGDFYGELSLFRPLPLASTGVALESAQVCMLSRDAVEALLHRSPRASLQMLSALSARIVELESLAEQLAVHPVEGRVAALLLKLAHARGAAQDGAVVEMPLTQEETAKLVGTTQETLSRKLHAMEDAGLIRLEGRRSVRLLRIEELARRAEGL